jgi:hypothetical protein
MTGYSKPSTTSAITTSNSLNDALGKLEAGLDTKLALDTNNNLLLASSTEYPFFNLTVSSQTLGNSRTLRFSSYSFESPQMEYHPDCPDTTVQMPTIIQNMNVNNFFAVGQKITYVDANGSTQSTTVTYISPLASKTVELSDPILEEGLVLTFYSLPLKCNALNVLTVGQDSKAGYNCQTVVGQYNDNKENTLFEVGNGTDAGTRSNALEVLKDGRVKVYGTPAEDNDIVRKQDLDNNVVLDSDRNFVVKTCSTNCPFIIANIGTYKAGTTYFSLYAASL